MTEIKSTTGAQRAKWREQATRIARELRRRQPVAKDPDGKLRIGVAFDDGLVKIVLDPTVIDFMTAQQLSEHIYNLVIDEAKKPDGAIPLKEIANSIAATASDNGKLIETGWLAMLAATVPPDAGPNTINALHTAFYCGAQHLFSSILAILDKGPDTEPTDQDMARMSMIAKELEEWATKMKAGEQYSQEPKGTVQ